MIIILRKHKKERWTIRFDYYFLNYCIKYSNKPEKGGGSGVVYKYKKRERWPSNKMKSETGQGYMNKSKLKHLLFIIFFSFSSLQFTQTHSHITQQTMLAIITALLLLVSLLVIPTSEPLFPNWTGYRSIQSTTLVHTARRQKSIKQNTPSKSWKVRPYRYEFYCTNSVFNDVDEDDFDDDDDDNW